jgi:glucosamine--fructose-6-phosphate aminotransferase (isomerizing)
MASEIAEQPEAVARTLDALLPLTSEISRVFANRNHVLFVARGTSDNAAVYGRYLVETMSGRHGALAAPSVATHYRASVNLHDTVAVSISQSGRTEEILETQNWARAQGARTIAVTNDPQSPLAADSDVALVTRAGEELAVPATKTYTAQLAALAIIAGSLSSESAGFARDLEAVPDALRRLLASVDRLEDAARTLADASGGTIVVSRGIAQTTALEIALKLEETCLRPTQGFSYADLRHGPLAVVDERLTAVIVAPADGPLLGGLVEMARRVSATGAKVIGIGGGQDLASLSNVSLPGPALREALAPIGLVIPGQLLVEATARLFGLDPDQPRALTKVTQTDRS